MQSQVTYLYIVGVGAGLREDSWDGWITAYFQIIFGALIPLKEISKMASWYSDKGDVIDRNHTSCQTFDFIFFLPLLRTGATPRLPFSCRRRLFLPLARGMRSELRMAWLMKNCFLLGGETRLAGELGREVHLRSSIRLESTKKYTFRYQIKERNPATLWY